ncbi:glycosyl transferase family 1 [candidate division KSB1 bacterium 4572_119]|nr:MAG: glycosyl transferase family 1 [candidate division KSB1 bacterium 4572_119]
MKILIVEPYFTGSHASWAKGYQKHSRHDIEILSLPGQFWKWRMHGGAITMADKFLGSNVSPDLILATDMLDLTTFLALTRDKTYGIPSAIYFHENQLCYPWSPEDRDVQQNRDKHYGFINYTSALCADAVFFNTGFQRDSLLTELTRMLKHFPDFRGMKNIHKIKAKSQVLHLGLDLKRFDQYKLEKRNELPLILWNHRWEFDKNPADFFNALYVMADKGLDFEVAVLGENFSNNPAEFDEARKKLGKRIVHFGYADSFEEYARWLWKADIVPVTSNQDFFGASAVEAVYCGCYPLLPNRLAFPEVMRYENNPAYFYDSFEQLVGKLEVMLGEKKYLDRENLSLAVEKYSWEKMIIQYDKIFEEVVTFKTR